MCEVKDPGDPTLLSSMGKPNKITEFWYATLPSDFNVALSMDVQNGADSKIYKSVMFLSHFIFFFFLAAVGSSLNFSSEAIFFTYASLNKYSFRTIWEYRARLV